MQSKTVAKLVLVPMMSALSAAVAQDVAVQAETSTTAAEAAPGSSVRIVRVSEVRGAVRMDRNVGRGYEPAFANIPVVAGAGLKSDDGVAEVELEDNSSLRLAPLSEIRFSKLSRMPTGGTVTTVEVVRGLVYVSLEKTKGNSFSLKQGAAEMVLAPGAHVRLDARQPEVRLAVLDGQANLQMDSTLTPVGKHQTVVLNPVARTVSTVVHGTEEGELDAWDKQGQQYHQAKASFAGSGGAAMYGAADLGYYGSFVNMPGCGSMWRPYFANAAWDPYGAGVWAYYPQSGYSWVSPYPWGWLPFHSGSWVSCGAAGWGWQPGNSWYGLNNVAMMHMLKRPLGHPLPTAPLRNAGALVPVNMKTAAFSGVSGGDRFTFRENSAGLGVPRQTFGHLNGMSTAVERHGMATGMISAETFARNGAAERSNGMARSVTMQGNAGAAAQGGMPGSLPMPSRGGGTAGHGGMSSSAGFSGGAPMGSASMSGASMGGARGGASMSAPGGGGAAGHR